MASQVICYLAEKGYNPFWRERACLEWYHDHNQRQGALNEIWEWMVKRQKAYEATDDFAYAKENAMPMKPDPNDSGNKSMNKRGGGSKSGGNPKNRKTSSGGKTPQKQLVANKAQKQEASSKGRWEWRNTATQAPLIQDGNGGIEGNKEISEVY